MSWSTIGNTFHEESSDREISRKSLTDYFGGCNIIIAASEAAVVPIGTIMAVEAGGPIRGQEEEEEDPHSLLVSLSRGDHL